MENIRKMNKFSQVGCLLGWSVGSVLQQVLTMRNVVSLFKSPKAIRKYRLFRTKVSLRIVKNEQKLPHKKYAFPTQFHLRKFRSTSCSRLSPLSVPFYALAGSSIPITPRATTTSRWSLECLWVIIENAISLEMNTTRKIREKKTAFSVDLGIILTL